MGKLLGLLRLCFLLMGVGLVVPTSVLESRPSCRPSAELSGVEEALAAHPDLGTCETESRHCHCWSEGEASPSRAVVPSWILAIWNPSETGLVVAGLARPGPGASFVRPAEWLAAPAPHSLGVGLRLYA